MDTKQLYKKIKDVIGERGGVKARAIAKQIGVEKKAVNRILYSNKYGREFRHDLLFRWYLTIDALNEDKTVKKPGTGTNEEELMAETPQMDSSSTDVLKPSKSSIHPSCKKCMIYKKDDCFGEKSICDLFKPSPDIPQEEIDAWPDIMGGPYGTLHKKEKKY